MSTQYCNLGSSSASSRKTFLVFQVATTDLEVPETLMYGGSCPFPLTSSQAIGIFRKPTVQRLRVWVLASHWPYFGPCLWYTSCVTSACHQAFHDAPLSWLSRGLRALASWDLVMIHLAHSEPSTASLKKIKNRSAEKSCQFGFHSFVICGNSGTGMVGSSFFPSPPLFILLDTAWCACLFSSLFLLF